MKKTFLAVALLCGLAAMLPCACSPQTEEEQPKTDTRVYNNVADFSSQQGWNGWYYLYRDAMGELYKMTFDLDGGRWNGRDFYCYNAPGEQHPGNNTETIIGWQATVDGTLSVEGSVVRNPVDWGGDGVFYYVALEGNDDSYLYSTLVEPLRKEPYTFSFETEVKRGDMLLFCINLNANNSYDSTSSNITISYL